MKILIAIILAIFASAAEYTNELIYEESPYLRQHAHNPVNWLPWGEKAFKKAKEEHKPIFLSIGYSTCHWCHVMERESFENEEIAKLINENFIPVKVDKEERPDIDRYYQTIYQVMHNRAGGWPLTIILTEDLKPFFSATYLPPEDGYGVKGLKTVLPILAKAYKSERDYIEKRAESVVKLTEKVLNQEYVPVQLDSTLLYKTLEQIKKEYDESYGGFSKRIKFPQPSKLELLLDIYQLSGSKEALDMAVKTLKMMAKGGIFDQIEGGFFRYTTDRKWMIPHFEKMLYTNAELVRVYTRAYTITKNPLFKEVVVKTIENIDSRFGHGGLFFSASNADSEGEEGKYFVYEYKKSLEFLKRGGVKEAAKKLENLGITPDGNFDGDASNPHIKGPVDAKTIELLKKMRQKRVYPFIDKKIITAWNAMYIEAKLRAFVIEERYKKEALDSLEALLSSMSGKSKLYHQKYLDNAPKKEAFLDDYAYLLSALITAYEVTLDKKYLKKAEHIYDKAKKRFKTKKGWLYTKKDKKLPVRIDDSYFSSGYAVLLHSLMSLAELGYDLKLYSEVKKEIDKKSALIFHNPASFPTFTRLVFRYQYKDVIIKAKKETLLKYLKKIAFINYPYILPKAEEVKSFEACTIDSCFASGGFDEIKIKIENRLKPKSGTKWKTESFKNR